MNNTFHKSHNTFFKIITKNKLNELYRRADINTKILETDINSNLINKTCKVHINTECHIFINFFDSNKYKIGHISFHIDGKNSSLSEKSKQYGRFHISNNKIKSSKYTIKLNTNNKKSLSLSYNTSLHMRDELKEAVTVTLNILEDYFNEESPSYLGHYDNKYKNPCTTKIHLKMKLKNTYKKKSVI